MPALLLLNGPNLGILGRREPEIYGTDTLADIEAAVSATVADRGWKVIAAQHESEGELIHVIQDNYDTVGTIVNPGALMMAGWSLRGTRSRTTRHRLSRYTCRTYGRGSRSARVGDRAAGQWPHRGAGRVRVPARGPGAAAPGTGVVGSDGGQPGEVYRAVK